MTIGRPIPGPDKSLLDDLRDLQTYAAQFQSVINTAKQAAPAGATAYDTTGAAYAEIDAEGTPRVLKISQGWSSQLDAADLGPAVVEAYQTAVQQHLEQWGDDLQREGWQYDVREFDEKVAAAETPPANVFQVPTATGAPRDIGSLVSDLIGELDFAHDLARQPATPAAGAAAGPAASAARVSVTITGGQLGAVHIDAEWAQGKDAAAINGELSAALQTARLTQPPAPTRLPHADQLDDLLGEVMGFLTNHRKAK